MRTILIVMAVAAAALAALWGGIILATASPGGCPTALLEGTLEPAASGGGLVVRTEDREVRVSWPVGYGTGGGANGQTVLTRLFVQVARPGDHVSMGGGYGPTDDFVACGVIRVTPGPPSPEPRQPGEPQPGPAG